MYLFFDTETTGLPVSWNAPMTDLGNWPRVIQLAFARFDSAGKLCSKGVDLISPDGWEVPTGKFWTDHGYSTADNALRGIPMLAALHNFCEEIEPCEVMVAHNMAYDYNVLGAEMLRYGVKAPKKLKRICTKEVGTAFCKIPNTWGGFKWPKLSELHVALFGGDFEGAHDAAADVEALGRCFFELKRRGVITV